MIARARSDDQAKGASMRADILDATARLIAERGYAACTMRTVAEQVNIKAGSLYYHFASKDEIVEEILNSGIEMLLSDVQAQLDALPSGAPFADRLGAAVRTHLSRRLGKSTSYLLIYEHLPPVLKRRSRAMRDRYADLWFKLFTEARDNREIDPDLDIRVVVPFVLGSLNRVPEWFRAVRFREDEVLASILTMLLKGIENREAPAAARKRREKAAGLGRSA